MMAKVLLQCSPCSPASGLFMDLRTFPDHGGPLDVFICPYQVLRKNAGYDVSNLRPIPSTRRSAVAWRSRVLQLRCMAAVGKSRSFTFSTERWRAVLSEVEKRKEGMSPAELCLSRKPGNRGTSADTGNSEKGSRHKFEIEPRTESVEAKELPEERPLVLRGNSRHMYQTGTFKDAIQGPVVVSRKQQIAPNLDSTSDLGCEHFSRCSGCVLQNALDRPPVLQDAMIFFKKYGINDFAFTLGSLWEWRCRAKLAVRGTSENPLIGLFEEGSHIIVDIPSCRAHHPRINAAIELVKEAIRKLGIEPYDEETQSGHLRYIQMVVSTHNTSLPASERYENGKVQVTLVWNARDDNSAQAKFLQPMAEFLWRKGGLRCSKPIIHSIWANFQTSCTNTIFGGKWRHLLGDQVMWERIAGVDICLTPASFGQANIQAFEALLRKLQTYVKRGSAVVELYAGVGVIGISLAATRACSKVVVVSTTSPKERYRNRSVKCVEVNKESKTSFQLSLSRIPDSVNCKISWHCADASVTPISWLEGSDTVIVDPPRKGLDPSVIEALRNASLRGQGKLKSALPYVTAKVEKRPWVVRANQGVTKESSDSWNDEMQGSWPNTLIYVSCGWQSFKQDCTGLLQDDAWHLDEAHAFNFFPGTDSIEVLAVFKSGKSSKKVNTFKKLKMVKKHAGRNLRSVH